MANTTLNGSNRRRRALIAAVLTVIAVADSDLLSSPLRAQERGPWLLDNASGGGGRVVDTAIDPLNPDRQVIVTDLGGVLRTLDGGRTWERFNLGLADTNGFSNGANVVAAADEATGRTLWYLSWTGQRGQLEGG